MPRAAVDVVDETFVRVPPDLIRAVLDEPGFAALAWPRLRLETVRDRGVRGLRWRVDGDVVGEMEVWLEPWRDGTMVHHYLRGWARSGAGSAAARRHTRTWKSVIHPVKDVLENRPLYPSRHGRQH